MIVRISGGLGNQLFQYAFAYAVSQLNDESVALDLSRFDSSKLRRYELDEFDLPVSFASQDAVAALRYRERTLFQKVRRLIRYRKWNQGRALSGKVCRESGFRFDASDVIPTDWIRL